MDNKTREQVLKLISSYPYLLNNFYTDLNIDKVSIYQEFIDSLINEDASYGWVFNRDLDKNVHGFAAYEDSKFDTDIIGLKTVKIRALIADSNIALNEVIKEATISFRKSKIEYATYRFSSLDTCLVKAFLNCRFIKVDDYIILKKNVEDEQLAVGKPADFYVRRARREDSDTLQKNHAHTFIHSRFFNDPALTDDSAINIHKKWIDNSIKKRVADIVFVVVNNRNIPLGFITLQLTHKYGSDFGHIPLTGVKQEYTGMGLGALLMKEAFNWFRSNNIKFVLIETQGSNQNAINSYKHSGFIEIGRGITFSWAEKLI
jgi:ribosomal protein S18 acetylase RimI-like enzyme